MSKSSANPRKYSKGRDALDPSEPLIVYVEVRMEVHNLKNIDSHIRYLASRRPAAVAGILGVRKESNRVIVTFGIDMGPMRSALRGTSPRMQHGYDLLWDIWEQMVEYDPVFSSPPASADRAMAHKLGFRFPKVESMVDEEEELSPAGS